MELNQREKKYVHSWVNKAQPYYEQNKWMFGNSEPVTKQLLHNVITEMFFFLSEATPWVSSGRVLILRQMDEKSPECRFELYLDIDS